MILCGLQKLTLLDFPDRMACTVFTGGCNFRCPFCHNAALISGEEAQTAAVSEEELLNFLQKRKGILEGVCFTGGEPTLHPDLPDLLRKVKALGYPIKLDTNGSRPEMLRLLTEEKLIDYVAMDIKSSPRGYAKACGIEVRMEAIEESKEYLLQGRIPYEFRTTIVKGIHTEEDIVEAAHWIRGAEKYFLQQFVDSERVLQTGFSPYQSDEMKKILSAVLPVIPTAKLRGVE